MPTPQWAKAWKNVVTCLLWVLEQVEACMRATARCHVPMDIMTRALQITGVAAMFTRLATRVTALESRQRQGNMTDQEARARMQNRCDHVTEEGTSAWHRYGAGRAGSLALCRRCGLKLQWQASSKAWAEFVPKSQRSSSALPLPYTGRPITEAPSATSSSAPPSTQPKAQANFKATPPMRVPPPSPPPEDEEQERLQMWSSTMPATAMPRLDPQDEDEWSDVESMGVDDQEAA